jgi:hypothetical protein
MDSLLPELLTAHILPRLNTRYTATHMKFVSKYYYSICTDYLHNKKISTRREYVIWLMSFLDKLEHRDISTSDVNERNIVASGNMKHIKLSDNTCLYAAAYGHLHVLKWARENGCKWDSRTCSHAAIYGHLHVLQWARENGCDWDSWTCTCAAEGGHLNILQWARENGCDWDFRVCRQAIEFGHLHILKWAMENGCDWGPGCYNSAVEYGHADIVEWIEKNGLC